MVPPIAGNDPCSAHDPRRGSFLIHPQALLQPSCLQLSVLHMPLFHLRPRLLLAHHSRKGCPPVPHSLQLWSSFACETLLPCNTTA